mmetsp:Transcript_20208/g.32297  ORF Transcript_20208/g.32297 Transcript_20208/m.32297 type:complete len:264 (+) Transcript_20208:530-1321(+)
MLHATLRCFRIPSIVLIHHHITAERLKQARNRAIKRHNTGTSRRHQRGLGTPEITAKQALSRVGHKSNTAHVVLKIHRHRAQHLILLKLNLFLHVLSLFRHIASAFQFLAIRALINHLQSIEKLRLWIEPTFDTKNACIGARRTQIIQIIEFFAAKTFETRTFQQLIQRIIIKRSHTIRIANSHINEFTFLSNERLEINIANRFRIQSILFPRGVNLGTIQTFILQIIINLAFAVIIAHTILDHHCAARHILSSIASYTRQRR